MVIQTRINRNQFNQVSGEVFLPLTDILVLCFFWLAAGSLEMVFYTAFTKKIMQGCKNSLTDFPDITKLLSKIGLNTQ